MFFRLEISIYNVWVRPSEILKASLDYNLHILIYAIDLYEFLILFTLPRSSKYPFVLLTPPSLDRTLIGLYIHSLFLNRSTLPRKAPG